MIITEEKINQMKKIENTFNVAIALTVVAIIASIIVLVLHLSGWVGALVFLGFAAAVSAVLLALSEAKEKRMLGTINLKKGQTLYEVDYGCFEVAKVTVSNINTNESNRIINVMESVFPMHRNLYLEEETAQKALNGFIEKLCKDVAEYVGYNGTVSEEIKNDFMAGYRRYHSKRSAFSDPTSYDIAEVVMAITDYRDLKEHQTNRCDTAKAALKKSLTEQYKS